MVAIATVAGLGPAAPAGAEGCALLDTTCDDGAGEPAPAPGPAEPSPEPAPEAEGGGAPVSRDPAHLLALVNEVRADHGLGPLGARADVAAIAAEHSGAMAARHDIWHNDHFFSSESRRHLGAAILAENVAMGPDLDTIHRRLLESPGHRANILDGRLTHAGFGVAAGDDGTLFVTQGFMRPRAAAGPAAPAAAPAATPGSPPPPAPPAEVPATGDAGEVLIEHVGATVSAPAHGSTALTTRPVVASSPPDRWATLAAVLVALAGVATEITRRRCAAPTVAAGRPAPAH